MQRESFAELLNIGGTSSKALYEPQNIHQPDGIEKILNFAEAFRAKLEQKDISRINGKGNIRKERYQNAGITQHSTYL